MAREVPWKYLNHKWLFCKITQLKLLGPLHQKPYFFSRQPEKMVFPKKSRWNMIFLVLFGKMILLFPENMILHLRQKMKDDPSQKKCTEIWYFLQTFWKDGLFKNLRAWKWCFLYYLERWDFFPKNMTFFSWPQSERWPFSRNTWKYDIFCVHVLVLLTWHHAPPSKKNQRSSYPTQTHLKVIEVLDWHSRTSSSNSLYFHGDFYRPFHVLFSSEKNQET